jgi:hypothetical protein
MQLKLVLPLAGALILLLTLALVALGSARAPGAPDASQVTRTATSARATDAPQVTRTATFALG